MKRLIALPVVGVLLAGCFSMRPVDRVTPEIGASVAVDLNDAGRVALGPTMGPGVGQIQGHLVQRDSDDGWAISVSNVQYIHGGSQNWTGDTVHVKSDYISDYYANAFSPARTAVLGAVVAAGLVAAGSEALTPTSPVSGSDQQPGGGDTKQRLAPGLRIPIKPSTVIRVVQRLWSAIPVF